MKHSEFYEAVEATFGSALGRSYVSDLYLASLGATARDALSAGVNPGARMRAGFIAWIRVSGGADRLGLSV